MIDISFINNLIINGLHLFLVGVIFYQMYQSYKDRYETFSLMNEFMAHIQKNACNDILDLKIKISSLEFEISKLKTHDKYCTQQYENRLLVKENTKIDQHKE